MIGCLCLVLHAHLPFVRHPEHERFLEESWFFEAVVECYLPLLGMLDRWHGERLPVRLTFTLSPTLCEMLADRLLQARCARHLDRLVELAEKEVHRTHWQPDLQPVALMYLERLSRSRLLWHSWKGDLLQAFRACRDRRQVEIITSAATHAMLPLMLHHPASLRGQLATAIRAHRRHFGTSPEGFWLPECAYAPGLENFLREAGLRWFVLETHGILHSTPTPRFGPFAPILTPARVAAFGRDVDSARQVWSRHEGYPGDPWYREFYRDIGFDLDWDYVRDYTPSPAVRGFTGIKYHRITGGPGPKAVYEPAQALERTRVHARHFLEGRQDHLRQLSALMNRPPVIVCPYDAELFGHWWFEGPEFLDALVREAVLKFPGIQLLTPGDFLDRYPRQQIARPATSSWGEEGYWRVWLNEANHWVYPRLKISQEKLQNLVAARASESAFTDSALADRLLRQAARELLLAQASDWPFLLRQQEGEQYARSRVLEHLARFDWLCRGIVAGSVSEAELARVESQDNLFPDLEFRDWRI